MPTTGKITHWNRNKGYGFITPQSGDKRVFFHVSDFQGGKSQVRKGELVEYSLSKDKQGRPCAVGVSGFDPAQKEKKRSRFGSGYIELALVFLAVLALMAVAGRLPLNLLLLYLGASVLAYLFYAWDKSSAQRDAWRTPESTLHLLALLGGWPGAMIAQQVLRHKSKKREFRFIFWLTVIVNLGLLIYLTAGPGSSLPLLS